MAEIIWDSELGPSWPSDWSHTTVHAQFVAVTGDGADSNRLPDIAPSGNGEVIFTPSLRTVRYVGADGPYVVSLKQYRAVVDNEGYLCTPDTFGQPGERGIVLPSTDSPVIEPRGEDDNAFTWRVDFDLPAVTIRSDHIAVPVGGPYNLVDLLSPERAAGVVHIIDRVSARDAIQAAQEAQEAFEKFTWPVQVQDTPPENTDVIWVNPDEPAGTASDYALIAEAAADRAESVLRVDTSVGTRVFVGDTMIHYKSGERQMKDLLLNGWETDYDVILKRIDETVFLIIGHGRAGTTFSGENATSNRFLEIPQGFRPSGGLYVTVGELFLYDDDDNGTALISRTEYDLTTYNRLPMSGTLSWPTSDATPATLPGTPA